MTELHDIVGQIPIDQIAGLLGTDQETAKAAVEAAVPTLLAGMHNNAQAPDGAVALESALSQHQDGLIDGGVDVSQVDTADGEKIVSHVFGGQQDQVASQLAGTSQLGGVGGDLVKKLLPILAPIVMSYLASKVFGGRGGQSGANAAAGAGSGSQAGGIDLGGILGGLLGGAAGGAGGGLGDLLGGLLGGGHLGGGQQSSRSVAPEAGQDSGLEPQASSQGHAAGGAPQPGELIDVDLPGSQLEEKKNDDEGGLGGLLGGLFGKK